MMGQTVIEKVVDRDLCIGCGLCAPVCPKEILSINFNKFGEYVARLDSPCEIVCNLCLKVCPFSPGKDNEDTLAKERYADTAGIKHHKATGYYLKSYYGYSLGNEHRAQGAAGGLTTWLLENLIAQKMVDRVVCVTANDDPQKLFKFQVFDSIEGIKDSSGSAYYPVELSGVIKFILTHEGSYALVGLPCFVKAIRLAQKYNRKLRERVKYVIGLVCSQTKSKYYTQFLSAMAGGTDDPGKVYYRKKDPQKPSSNYAFVAQDAHRSPAEIYWKEGVGDVWDNRWFTPTACNYCDDVFAELADVSLMDAWLPEYTPESKGANLLVVRSKEIDGLIAHASEKKHIYVKDIPLERVVGSQAGGLKVKRDQLAYRLLLAKKNKDFVITKRVAPANTLNLFEQKEVEIKDRMQGKSREQFSKLKPLGKKEIPLFLIEDLKDLLFWKRIYSCLLFPARVLLKVGRICGVDHLDWIGKKWK